MAYARFSSTSKFYAYWSSGHESPTLEIHGPWPISQFHKASDIRRFEEGILIHLWSTSKPEMDKKECFSGLRRIFASFLKDVDMHA